MTNLSSIPTKTTVKYALEQFNSGFNWAESVLLAVSKAAEQDCECIPRIAAGLGGGLGGQGEVCGAVSGGVLAIGLLYGPNQGQDEATKAAVYLKAGEFVRRFAEINGAVRCIDLIEMDVSSDIGVRKYYRRDLKEETCSGIVSSAVQVLLDLLENWGA